jgi:chaperone required for assembly of F1-ATPase
VEGVKRFWTTAEVSAADGGWAIALDGRALRTPGRVPLEVPTQALADAIAAEWAAVEGEVRPGTMPLTGIANAAVDIVSPDPAAFAAALAAYGETDLTCYRAEGPQPLVARQVAAWEPALKAVEARHGLLFRRTAGIVHVAQPTETLARLRTLFAEFGPWRLAPLQPIVSLSGSAVLALALLAGLLEAEAAFDAAHVDEAWQAEQWGADTLALEARADRRSQFTAAVRFLRLLD